MTSASVEVFGHMATRMRILLVGASARAGGAERSAALLIDSLSSLGVTCVLVHAGGMERGWLAGFQGRCFRTCVFEPVRRMTLIRAMELATRWLYGMCVIIHAIMRSRPDLIHANTTASLLVCVLPAWLTRRPVIWHVRDMARLGRLATVLARRVAAIVAVSHAVREHLIREGVPQEKVQVVLNAVDAGRMLSAAVHESRACMRNLGVPRNAFVYLNVGQYVVWKKQELFLRAAAIVARERPASYFLIVGGKPSAGDPGCKHRLIEQAVSLGISDRTKCLDWQHDIGTIMSGCHVLVHTASAEPFGRVLIEAMAVGLPVIAVRSGGPLDIIQPERSGLLIPADDEQALTAAMLRVQHDGALADRLALAGRKRVLQEFTSEECARNVLRIYVGIINPKENDPWRA